MSSLVSVVCCQVEVYIGWSLIQRSLTVCGVTYCDNETSIMRRPWLTRGCCAMVNEIPQREASIFSYVNRLLVLVYVGISKLGKKISSY
jgi:hypothetical protein